LLAGDHQGAMLKLHTEPEPVRAERPVKAEAVKPAKAEAAAKKKAKTEEAPAKPARPAPAEKTAKVEKEETAGKGGGIGSFLKKLIPGSDAARKK
jgi:hypothetical protein